MRGRKGLLAKLLSIPVLAACGFVVAATAAGGGVAGVLSGTPTPAPSSPPATSPMPTTRPATPTPNPTPVPTTTTAPPTTTTTTTRPPHFEGCSHGFWKNHPDKWSGYSPYQKVKSVFPAAPADIKNLTLLEGLKLGGGGANALTRQAVAALLNAAHPEVDYPLTTRQVIALVNGAFASGKRVFIESLKYTLDHFNNLGASGFCDSPSEPFTTRRVVRLCRRSRDSG